MTEKLKHTHQEIRFCRAGDGVRLAYAVTGSGPALIKASNWLSHLEYEWDSPVWRHWYRTLSSHFTLIRYDQRGCGLSDREPRDISLEAWVSDLNAVAEAAGADRFHLLGISQGGAVAAAFASAFPEKVRRLVIYGGYLRGRQHRETSPRHREETRVLRSLIRTGWDSENPAFRQVFTTLFLPDGSPDQIASLNRLHKASTSADIAERIVACFDGIDVRRPADKISVPAFVCHAREDARVPFEEGRFAAATIPGAKLLPLESRNHILQEAEPAWDTFLAELLGFCLPVEKETANVPFPGLTARERDVLDLIAGGLPNETIAERLCISPKTVRNHITRIFGKLSVESRAQAIVKARDAGMGKEPSL